MVVVKLKVSKVKLEERGASLLSSKNQETKTKTRKKDSKEKEEETKKEKGLMKKAIEYFDQKKAKMKD